MRALRSPVWRLYVAWVLLNRLLTLPKLSTEKCASPQDDYSSVQVCNPPLPIILPAKIISLCASEKHCIRQNIWMAECRLWSCCLLTISKRSKWDVGIVRCKFLIPVSVSATTSLRFSHYIQHELTPNTAHFARCFICPRPFQSSSTSCKPVRISLRQNEQWWSSSNGIISKISGYTASHQHSTIYFLDTTAFTINL